MGSATNPPVSASVGEAYTVATLPSAAPAYQRNFVSNALNPILAAIVVSGGAATVPVYSDGAVWRVG